MLGGDFAISLEQPGQTLEPLLINLLFGFIQLFWLEIHGIKSFQRPALHGTDESLSRGFIEHFYFQVMHGLIKFNIGFKRKHHPRAADKVSFRAENGADLTEGGQHSIQRIRLDRHVNVSQKIIFSLIKA